MNILDQGSTASDVAVIGHPGSDAWRWAEQINSEWRKSLQSVIETGRILLEAKASLAHGSFEAMVQTSLDFSPRVAQRLMVIARDNRLSNPTHASHLPKAWTTLYEIATLTDEEFERGLAEGVINPKMERADVARIRDNGSDGGVESGHAGRDGYPVGLTQTRADLAGVAAGPSDEERFCEGAQWIAERAVRFADGNRPPIVMNEEALPNGARAIMGSREEPSDSLDYFPTPPWATRALVEHVLAHLDRRGHCQWQTAWEPACGEGHMSEVLREYFRRVIASDINPDGAAEFAQDFTKAELSFDANWIITNPPFGDKTEAFVLKALQLAATGVAMFVRLQWLESAGRYERIFKPHPPTLVAVFSERVPLHKERWEPDGATATAYIWLVWIKGAEPRAPFWIPPGCRQSLSKPEDVERFAAKLAAKIKANEEAAA